ncbi:M4 family metallopeptidase [Paucibacter sp. TC2R-5]|uniref:M4 family metallopeptidase n=1 Tax=Paucibacter sp. TC2R-5 TaxID=2893555 RepID=UPI0021E39514|nr:M4 family metallopeptidase [Paucibacter sp. TC2R-5]MCV2360723.1 M4 family metallopeptidase [Paucibacter sp. TC2R-5]
MSRTKFRVSLMTLAVGMAMSAQAQTSLKGQNEAIARLTANTGNGTEVAIHTATGAARFVRVAPASKLSAASGLRAIAPVANEASSIQVLSEYAGLFGISNASSELGAARVQSDRLGGTHLTHKQFYKGVPVFGAELKTHFDAGHNLTAINGTFVPGIELNVTPTKAAKQASATALAIASAERAGKKLTAGKPELMVFRDGLAKGVVGANYLVWQVEVGNGVDVREFVFVDAHTGKLVERITGIHDAMNRRAYDGAGVATPGPNYPNNPFWKEGDQLPTQNTEADNMIYASEDTYKFFKNAFGRDSFDGNGATMHAVFNRGGAGACPNASWNGTLISFCPGITTDDVTAHEWAHAYTQYTHGLIYAYQSGALNEAYSDIWGETVDRINGRGGDAPNSARTAGACTASTKVAQVSIAAPAAVAGVKLTGTTTFGPQVFNQPGSVVGVQVGLVNANAGNAIVSACGSGFSGGVDLVAGSLTGKIAYIDRGTCAASIKVKNAQNAGAIGVIIGNNQGATVAPNFTGDDATITIPSLTVSQNDGTAIKAQLVNGVSATLARGPGSDNSVSWLVGEDSTAVGLVGALRDMYTPTCYGNPGKVSDAQYSCAPNTQAGDWGGVHNNSGVPNHGYALLVDGGTYNGQTVNGIGLTKAAHIYFRAQNIYQNPVSSFADHADALKMSCSDLTGKSLNHLKTGAVSGEVISAADCAQVEKMALAVELRKPVEQCGYGPMLAKTPPALCPSGNPSSLLSDNFEGGRRGGANWLVSYAGNNPEFTPRTWKVVNNLLGGRAGSALFAADANIGKCAVGDNQAGLQRLESPEVTVPANGAKLSFDHYVATEAGYDGGNIKYSVNGGAWTVVPASAFIYNPYNMAAMLSPADGSDSPLAGEPGFSGTDGGQLAGSWGRSIVNLSALSGVTTGAKVKLRFEAANDGCGGAIGWFLDDVMVYSCKP